MATFAIGDIQGCWRTLVRLLSRIGYDRRHHRLWLAGDLVNRGPASLEVLRWARDQGASLVSVLGNHDLHLLGVAFGVRDVRKGDTLETVLAAPDRSDLIEWLLHRPLLHPQGRYVLVHAGIPSRWSLELARELASETETALRKDPRKALRAYGDRTLTRWDGGGGRRERLTQALRGLTLLRTEHPDGRPCEGFSGPPSAAPSGCRPWFEARPPGPIIVCGHWAALGLHLTGRVRALDTGCVWGGRLTALRLHDGALFRQPSLDA
jgi:bis(5'-nucleosyl)-tetraphosphatase (symmetrical)